MKYVIIEKNFAEVPIIFPDMIPHDFFSNLKPISAGKMRVGKNNEYFAWGASHSLQLKSRPEDAEIIKHAFEFEGV